MVNLSVLVNIGRVIVFIFIFYLFHSCTSSNKNQEVRQQDDAEVSVSSEGEVKEQSKPLTAGDIESIADPKSWYYYDVDSSKTLKKALGKKASQYEPMVTAAAYRVAATMREGKVTNVLTLDGKVFKVDTTKPGKPYERYIVSLSQLKDPSGKYYTAETAMNAEPVKTEQQIKNEKFIENDQKGIPEEIARPVVEAVIKKNAMHPSTVDFDFLHREFTGVYDDGTKEFEYGFTAKNSFGAEMHYYAVVQVSPKGVGKIISMREE